MFVKIDLCACNYATISKCLLHRTDIFRLLASEQIGRINKIQIRTDGTGEEPSWFLNEAILLSYYATSHFCCPAYSSSSQY